MFEIVEQTSTMGARIKVIGIGGGGSVSDANESWRANWKYNDNNEFHNDAKNLSISLEYALCTIERPWLVGDLFYTQLLYPALLDRGLGADAVDAALLEHGQRLTGSVVARLHASAPVVVHVHDALGWWEDHDPGGSLPELLALPPRDAIAGGGRAFSLSSAAGATRRASTRQLASSNLPRPMT